MIYLNFLTHMFTCYTTFCVVFLWLFINIKFSEMLRFLCKFLCKNCHIVLIDCDANMFTNKERERERVERVS